MHINARSLLYKLDDVELLLQNIQNGFDVLDVSETWEALTTAQLITIPGYVKILSMRPKRQKGGGVAIFIKKEIEFKQNNINTRTFESVF